MAGTESPMNTKTSGRTTTSVEGVPNFDVVSDPTCGLALVYSRLHVHLPSAVPFATPTVTLGRESDNALSVPEAAVSRYHARFERREDGHFWVVDQGSTNGTFVNGRRVREWQLRAHDVLRIGDTIFRFVERSIYGFGAYRIDGTVVEQARPFAHGVRAPLLVGGYQIDTITDRIAKVADSNISVVVHGESGTGKEVVAREFHRLSKRPGAFQAINCAALPENLIESELFGYRRGAFSGATSDKTGLVRAADRGTLFLDEIGDMPLEAQAKLLRVLQEKEVTPIGATAPEPVEVRVICATHRDLEALVRQHKFRGDLYSRLLGLTIQLPALRERREDLYALVLYFLRRLGQTEPNVTFPFMLAVAHHDWPYNVRELESAIRVAHTLSGGGPIDLAHLPDPVKRALDSHGAPAESAPPTPAASGGSTRRDAVLRSPPEAPQVQAARRGDAPTKEQLLALLERHNGNIAAVGRELGKERMQVHRWLRKYALDVERFRQ
jgi:DNA-binding NtrC family response regulator